MTRGGPETRSRTSNRAELLARAFLNLHIAVAEIVRRAAKTESDVARLASDVFHERFGPASELPDGMAEELARAICPVWLASPCR